MNNDLNALLTVLSTLSVLNHETVLKMLEVLKDLQGKIAEAQKHLNEMSVRRALELVLQRRVQVVEFGTPCGMYRDLRQIAVICDGGLAVPVFVSPPDSYFHGTLTVSIFNHQYLADVRKGDSWTRSESVSRQWQVATISSVTADYESAQNFWRAFFSAIQMADIKHVYCQPPYTAMSHTECLIAKLAFEQVRKDLNIECELIEKWDARFAEYKDGQIVLRSDAPSLLKYLS